MNSSNFRVYFTLAPQFELAAFQVLGSNAGLWLPYWSVQDQFHTKEHRFDDLCDSFQFTFYIFLLNDF